MGAALGRRMLAATLVALWSWGGIEGRAGSVTVIGNLPQANDSTFSAVASLGGTYAKAVGFTMGTDSYWIETVTLRLMEQAGSQSLLTVKLYDGQTDSTPLSFEPAPTIPPVAADVTFTPQ